MFHIDKIQVAGPWKQRLSEAGLLDIEAVSKRDFDWVERPNKRRGGWSGVSRIVLNPEAPADAQQAVFLKIQQNHFYRAVHTGLRKRLTYERELEALGELSAISDAIPEVLLFAKWRSGKDLGSVFVTEALDAWIPLREWLLGANGLTPPDDATFHRALDAIAATARQINDAGWAHRCYSAKHIFLSPREDGSFRVCLIDMEKSRKYLNPGRRIIADCSHFFRRSPNLSDARKLYYLKSYFQTQDFSPSQLRLIRKMRGAPSV